MKNDEILNLLAISRNRLVRLKRRLTFKLNAKEQRATIRMLLRERETAWNYLRMIAKNSGTSVAVGVFHSLHLLEVMPVLL